MIDSVIFNHLLLIGVSLIRESSTIRLMRSTTCKGSNGQFLEEYHSQSAAMFAAEERNVQTGRDQPVHFAPIQCSKCGYWHLKAENTRRKCMFCTDSALFLKDIYSTREEAQRTADHLRKEKKVMLLPYKCPHGSGWHLTKVRN